MSFNKRFLSKESIISQAKNNSFHWFQRYMVYADAYIIEDDGTQWASKFYDEFGKAGEDSEKRKDMWEKLKNEN